MVFRIGDAEMIKRVVGMPGETIEVRGDKVLINGEELVEWYDVIPWKSENRSAPQEVGDDEFFVLGDNRGASNDSRYFGPV